MKKLLSVILMVALLICAVPLCAFTLTASAQTQGYYTYTVSNGEATITDVDTSISSNVTIPSTLGGYAVTKIGYSAFDYCESLTSVSIPDSVTSIGACAFECCTSLKSVSIPYGVTIIDGETFYGCTSLKSVSIPDSVTSIESFAFYGCTSLESINIPDGITRISYSTFNGCTSLENITIPDGVTHISECAFYETGYYNNKNNWQDGVLYIGNYLIAAKDTVVNCDIKKGTKVIADRAFFCCEDLESASIPDGVVCIGMDAFEGCTSLESINIPDSVIEIYDSSFWGTEYYYNESNWQNGMLYIGNYLIDVNSDLVNCDIKKGTKVIACGAFNFCEGIKSISIPNSVKYIGDIIYFGVVIKSLTDIWYGGSITDKENIIISDYNEELYNAKWHYNTCKSGEHTYLNDTDTTCEKCDMQRLFGTISPNESGVYNITPGNTVVLDSNGREIKYNEKQGGWPLVKGQKYTLSADNYTGDKEIECRLIKKLDNIFPDTSSSGWYNDAVVYAVSKGIINGYSNGLFGPSDSIQRQDFLVMLARYDGVDLSAYQNTHGRFRDVGAGSYYEAAVNWGAEKGIVSGYQNGNFGVSDTITREQLVTFLYRYANYKGIDVTYSQSTKQTVSSQYKDYGSVSDWAESCVLWAMENSVIKGKNPTTIMPQGDAQRCEVAQIMYNIYLNDVL